MWPHTSAHGKVPEAKTNKAEGLGMRLFRLERDTDHTGVSGTGIVAEGCQFTDATVVLRWLSEHASTVVWRNIDDAMTVHGHDGATRLVWVDDYT